MRSAVDKVDGQLGALKAQGCDPIFADLDFRAGQPELERMFQLLESGDTVIVMSVDRIAGSLTELLNTLRRIKLSNCSFRSLTEPWADSISTTGALTLAILEMLANLDRNFKRIAAAEGRSKARAKGIHLGRSSKLTLGQRQEAIARREAGEPLTAIARSYGVSRTTIKRLEP